MDSSTTIKTISGAFCKAQGEIKDTLKDKDNPFFKSKYADLQSVVEAIKPSLTKYGLSFTQVCHDSPDGVKIETIILHDSGEWLSCGCLSVPAAKKDPQGYGSALTYARRYSLSAAFGVTTDEDDDGKAAVKGVHDEIIDKNLADKKELSEEEAKKARQEKFAPTFLDEILEKVKRETPLIHLKNYEAILYGESETPKGIAHSHFNATKKLNAKEVDQIRQAIDKRSKELIGKDDI